MQPASILHSHICSRSQLSTKSAIMTRFVSQVWQDAASGPPQLRHSCQHADQHCRAGGIQPGMHLPACLQLHAWHNGTHQQVQPVSAAHPSLNLCTSHTSCLSHVLLMCICSHTVVSKPPEQQFLTNFGVHVQVQDALRNMTASSDNGTLYRQLSSTGQFPGLTAVSLQSVDSIQVQLATPPAPGSTRKPPSGQCIHLSLHSNVQLAFLDHKPAALHMDPAQIPSILPLRP